MECDDGDWRIIIKNSNDPTSALTCPPFMTPIYQIDLLNKKRKDKHVFIINNIIIINHNTINSPQMRCQQFFLVRLSIYADNAHFWLFSWQIIKSNGWSDVDQRSKNTKRNGNDLSTLWCTCLKFFNGAMPKRCLQDYWMRCIHDRAPSCISI